MKEELEQPYTKKCSARIYGKVLKVNPSAKKTTTWDQAWVTLATAYNMEGSVECGLHDTVYTIYKDDEEVEKIIWNKRMWNDRDGDFMWNEIYKEVFDRCLEKKLLKVTKKKKIRKNIK